MENLPSRSRWSVCWAACDRDRLEKVYRGLTKSMEVVPLKSTVAGLGLLQIRESVQGEGFHLGEFSLSTAAVEITHPGFGAARGGASIMADDEDLAVILAVFDALVANAWDGHTSLHELLIEGEQKLLEESNNRMRVLSSTSIDFSTLDEDS